MNDAQLMISAVVFLALGLALGIWGGRLSLRSTVAQREQELNTRCAELETGRELAGQQAAQAEQRLQETSAELASAREETTGLVAEKARLLAELEQQRKQAEEKLALLGEARQQLTTQFESLANKIFDAKQEKFRNSSQDSLEQALKPFRDQLKDFRHRVDDIYDKENRERGSLRQELKSLQELNQRISQEALNLTRALKGENKTQGNWGEVILERVLEESGLHKGREYETQCSFSDESGRRLQPDVIVHLPDNKDIVIDAKMSLVAYERYCNSDDEDERQQALQQHLASVRSHIAGLSAKQYENIEGIRTLDFVFIFIPIESAFMAAFEHDPELFKQAYEKNIVVVSPTTLLATLRTVQSIWRYERQNRNAEAIAKEAGGLHDQFARVLESLQDIGKHLDRGRESYEKTLDRLSRGRGNMVNRVAKLERLGAKVKKSLPSAITESSEIDAIELADSDNPED